MRIISMTIISCLSILLASFLHGASEVPLPLTKETRPFSLMQIDPKMRAMDYKEAFEILRKEKTANKVFFELADGSSLSNIIEMSLLGSGSLILFKYNSLQGIRFQVVNVEDILSIQHLP